MDVPLAFMQRRYLLDAADGWSNFNVTLCWRVEGDVDLDALCWAWRRLTQRHAALRTRIVLADDAWVQRVSSDAPLPIDRLPRTAMRTTDPATIEAIRALADRRAPVRGGALARAFLLPCTDGCLLLLAVHHIVMDGVSTTILDHRLRRLYAARVAGTEPEEGPEGVTLGDHALADLRAAATVDRAFWRRVVRPDPPAAVDERWLHARKPLHCAQGPRISAATMQALRARARRSRIPFFGLLLAAVARCAPVRGAEDQVTCAVVRANRDGPGTERAVGLFVDFLPVCVERCSAPGFEALARRAARAWRESLVHAAPLGAIGDALDGPAEWPLATAYHVSLNYQPGAAIDGPAAPAADATLRWSRLIIPFPLRRIEIHRWACGSYPFEFNLAETPDGGLSIRSLRVGEIVSADAATRLVEQLRRLLEREARA